MALILNFIKQRNILLKTVKNIRKCYFSTAKHSIDDNLSFSSPKFAKYINNLKNEYKDLIIQNKLDKSLIVRLQYLKPIVEICNQYEEILENVKSLDELEKENELKQLVDEERQNYNKRLTQLEANLKNVLLKSQENVHNGILFEITAGVGGQEAMLFARDLYEMYLNYFIYKGWDYKLADLDSSDIGGVRHVSLLIEGEDVYGCLNVEAGVHRVQRVPSTEKSGRIHTSTVTVAVLPQPNDVDIQIKSSDLRIETKRASGAGGQHVNTTDSAVRIVHLPTGLAVECQTERSQLKNKEIALQRLKTQLYQNELQEQISETKQTRKSQVGSSLRNEKVRTYNFNQHRVSDHRTQETIYNLDAFLKGNDVLDDFIQKLRHDLQIHLLLECVDAFEKN